MPVRDDLGVRMKEFYEQIPKTKLMRRTPVAIRIDGRAFHTFTRGFQKPFDEFLIRSMQETMTYLCENIQGAKFGYTQSDEITIILTDYDTLETSAWFDYEVQKLCSIAASIATMAFNKYFTKNVENFVQDCATDYETQGLYGEGTVEYELCKTYQKALDKGAMFDARCFNIPKEEVTNLIYWRQLDATRNSIQMVGQSNFSHKELQNKTCNMIQDMLHEQKGINWNNFPIYQKRGSACIKKITVPSDLSENPHYEWFIDKNMPILKGEDRKYLDRFIYIGNE